MATPSTERICLHPLCDRPVGDPNLALSRREREAREYGYCVSRHPWAVRDPESPKGWRLGTDADG